MNEENQSVFDSDIETQFDTADIVFALTAIRKELVTTNMALAIIAGIGIVGVYYAAKRL